MKKFFAVIFVLLIFYIMIRFTGSMDSMFLGG